MLVIKAKEIITFGNPTALNHPFPNHNLGRVKKKKKIYHFTNEVFSLQYFVLFANH